MLDTIWQSIPAALCVFWGQHLTLFLLPIYELVFFFFCLLRWAGELGPVRQDEAGKAGGRVRDAPTEDGHDVSEPQHVGPGRIKTRLNNA